MASSQWATEGAAPRQTAARELARRIYQPLGLRHTFSS
jgi:hypothetical protein